MHRTSIDRRGFLISAAGAAVALGPLAALRHPAHAAGHGGTLRIGVPESFSSLDPFKKIGRLDYNAVINVFDTLAAYDASYVPGPALAESWTQDDELTWRFQLRQGVSHHDGTPFDAASAAWSFERILEGNFGRQFAPIDSVTATGSHELTIACSSPFPTMIVQLTQQYASMVSPQAFEAAGDAFGRMPVGSGPFMVESLDPGRELVLARNDAWWGRGPDGEQLPYLDKVVWTVMPDKETAALALRNAEIDFLYSVPTAVAPMLMGDPDVSVSIAPTLGWEFIMFNASQPPFDNVHARRAVQLAIDRQSIVDAVSFGTATPCLGPITPGSWAYGGPREDGLIKPHADQDGARRELEQGGLADGFSFTLVHPTFPEFNAMSQAIQAQLAEVGIDMQLDGKDIGATLDDLFASRFSALMIDWSGRADEALVFPSFFRSDGGNNFGKFADPAVDPVIDAAGAAGSIAERAQLYQEAERMIVEQSPLAWLTIPSEIRATRANVNGFVNYGDLRIRAWTISIG